MCVHLELQGSGLSRECAHIWITTGSDIRGFDIRAGTDGPVYPMRQGWGLQCYRP